MKMLMILLVSAAAVLVSSVSLHNPQNYKSIINIIDVYNNTLNKELYVESVAHLYNSNNKCSNAFFCKVHEILVKHKNESGNDQDVRLIRNLKQVIQKHNCEETLKTVTSVSEKILFPDFLDYLKQCIQCRNTKPSEPNC